MCVHHLLRFGDSKYLGGLCSFENNTTKKLHLVFQVSADKINWIKVKVGISIACNRTNWRCYNTQCSESFRMLKE